MNTDKIRNMLASLRNFNIRDLQNIDARQVVEMVRQRLDIVINGVLIFVTVIVMVNVVRGNGKKLTVLAWEATQMQERLDAVKESERLRGEYEVFMRNFPRSILTDQLISKLSEFAAYRHVQILAFSPVKEKGDDYIQVAGVQINVAAEDYKNIVLFMKDIEDAPYALLVEQWSAKMKDQRIKEGPGEIRKQIVEADIRIGSITLKDE